MPDPAAADPGRPPAGSYYLAVLADFNPDAWHDRSFLRSVTAGAFKVELKAGEQLRRDLEVH